MNSADPAPAVDAVDRYLARPVGAFWRWSPTGEAIETSHRRSADANSATHVTIAFREELATLLAPQSSRGLPPFGAVIAVLAATRDGWHRNSNETVGLQPATLDALALIHGLPASLRSTPDARSLLIATLFESTPPTCAPRTARDVVEQLGRASFSAPEPREPNDHDEASLRAALTPWIDPEETPSEESVEKLALALRTGLDQLPRRADLISHPDTARELLAELRRDPKLSGFARLVDTVRGTVVVPPLRVGREDLPTGGVADVSHRGPIERLLLTELAHDDENLAVRVALDEALYLRREAARVRPPVDRTLLLDAGLRTWGLPRVILAAVALAWIVENDGDVRVQRADSPLTPIRLDHRTDLIAHLASVSPNLDATTDLTTFASTCRPDEEPVLLLHRRTVESPEFRTELSRCPALTRGVLVATIDEFGHYGVARWTHRGRVALREGVLDLRPIAGVSTDDLAPSPGLPRWFQVHPFPLALAAPPESPSLAVGDHFLVVPDSARLLRTDARGIGAEIHRNLPAGDLLWLSEERGTIRFVVRSSENASVIASVIRPDGAVHRVTCPCDETIVAADFSLGDHVGLFLGEPDRPAETDRVRIHSIERETPITEFPARPLPVRTRWPQPVFFGCGENHATLGRLAHGAGGRDWFTAFPQPTATSLLAACQPFGNEWPSLIDREGNLSSLDPRDASTTPVGRVWAIARDGSRIRVVRESKGETYDLRSKRSLLETEPLDPTPEFRTQRSDFSGPITSIVVGPDRAGEPGAWIGDASSAFQRIDRRSKRGAQGPADAPPQPRHPQRDARPFGERTSLPDSTLTVVRADFPDGSTAWLDDRGVLFLSPSNSAVRSVAVVVAAVDARGNLQGSDLGWIAPDRVLAPSRENLAARDQAVAAFARRVIEAGGTP